LVQSLLFAEQQEVFADPLRLFLAEPLRQLRLRVLQLAVGEDFDEVVGVDPAFKFGGKALQDVDRDAYEPVTLGVAVEFFAASSTVGFWNSSIAFL